MPDQEKTKVRTTMQPDVEIEVGPQELLDLERQGLLRGATEDPAADNPPPVTRRASAARGEQ
jgi:hypothetical protein